MDDRHGDPIDEGAIERGTSRQRDANRVPRMKAKSQRRANQRKRKATAVRGICARRHRRY